KQEFGGLMSVSPSGFGSQPFSQQQRYLLVLVAGLLLVILVITAFLAFNSFQPGGTFLSQPIWLGVLFFLALLLTALVILLAYSFRRTVGAEFTRAYDTLASQVVDRERAEMTLRSQNNYLNALNETAVALAGRLDLN